VAKVNEKAARAAKARTRSVTKSRTAVVRMAKKKAAKSVGLVENARKMTTGEVMIVGREGNQVRFKKFTTRRRLSDVFHTFMTNEKHHTEPTGSGELSKTELGALLKGGFNMEPLKPEDEDPIAIAAAQYAKLREESLTTSEAADILNVNGSRVRQRLIARPPTLYGIKVDGDWRLPTFQFGDDGLIPGIDVVIRRLREQLHPVGVVRWFNIHNPDLFDEQENPLTPIEWLRTGRSPEAVALLAADL